MEFLKNINVFSDLNMLVILWSYYVKPKLLPNLWWPITRMLNSMSCCLKSQGLCFWLEVGIWDSRAGVLGLFIQRSTLKVWTSKKKKLLTLGRSQWWHIWAIEDSWLHWVSCLRALVQRLAKAHQSIGIFAKTVCVPHFLTSIHPDVSSEFNCWVTGAIIFHQAFLQQ